jgi:hypothetical protein
MNTLTPHEEALAQRIADLVAAKLGAATLNQSLIETVGLAELKAMLGCRSTGAVYRIVRKIGIRPYARGRYRRKDVVERIARSSYQANHPR